jgi:lipoprotein NlpD
MLNTFHAARSNAIAAVARAVSAAAVLICALWLTGCASDPASVEDRSIGEPPPRRVVENTTPRAYLPPNGNYHVARGDTLYSIAFKRGLDYRDVANWNGIAPPYKIFVGQELRFNAPSNMPASLPPPIPPRVQNGNAPVALGAAPAAIPPSAPAPGKNSGMFEDVTDEPVVTASAVPATINAAPAPAAPAASPAPPPTTVAAISPVTSPATTQAKSAAEIIPPPPKPVNDSATSNVNGIAWRWPNAGKLVAGFVAGDQTKQGVDIAGAAGDPVQAAADGDVVYSGNGLLGYGELIIVKHNASFLSAYGHNRKRLVQEGDKVHAGQQIAEMGSSASSRDELHFEIRKNGKPVNPLEYLPAR